MSSPSIRISASRLKTLWHCSMEFYYQEVLGLPSESHWKTKVGNITHATFECIMHPRRLALFKSIILAPSDQPFSLRAHPALTRFVQWQLRKEGIADRATVDDIGELLHVAWMGIRRYFVAEIVDDYGNLIILFRPPPFYINEYRFQLTIGDAVISGFIDLLLIWDGWAVCIDLKTQAAKFTVAELPHNIQGILYQAATDQTIGLIPAVEFIMLRHAPKKRYPNLHIQRVESPSRAHLEGLKHYVQHMFRKVNQFGLEDAYAHPTEDVGFCSRVCSFYKPFPYWIILTANGAPKGGREGAFLSVDKATEHAHDGETIEMRQHAGCALRWNPST